MIFTVCVSESPPVKSITISVSHGGTDSDSTDSDGNDYDVREIGR